MDPQQLFNQLKELDDKILAAIIAALAAVGVGIINLFTQIRAQNLQKNQFETAQRAQNKQFETAQNALKLKALQEQLGGFYIPFDTYLTLTTELYKNVRNGLPREFRTLVYLVNRDTMFEDSDGKFVKVTLAQEKLDIIAKIIEIQDKLKTLIIEKSYLVEDDVLTKDFTLDKSITSIKLFVDKEAPGSIPNKLGLLDFFNFHMDYIKMAKDGNLQKEDIKSIELYVYPRELNNIIKDRKAKLEAKIKDLQ